LKSPTRLSPASFPARSRRIFYILALLGAATSIVFTLAFSYRQNQKACINELDNGAGLWKDLLLRVFSNARSDLAGAALRIQEQPIDKVRVILQKLMMEKPAFREASLIVDGRIVCTSFEICDPPRPAIDATAPSTPGSLYIGPVTNSPLGGPFLLLNYQAAPDKLLNALVAPQLLMLAFQLVAPRADYAVFVRRADGVSLITSEGAENFAPPPRGSPEGGTMKENFSLTVTKKVPDFNAYVTAIMPAHVVWKRWLDGLPLFGIFALIAASLFFAAAWKISRHYLSFEAEMREAIRKHRIEPFFQPIIDAATGRCTSAEVLMRWKDPHRGMIPPASFVPEAERSDLITDLTLSMTERIAEYLPTFLAQNPDFHVNINLCAQTLNEADFFPRFRKVIGRAIPLRQIHFEVTESASMSVDVTERLAEFKRHGIKLAVDDFGTGYSNLRYLRDFPFDSLKIDKVFVSGITSATESSGLVDHVIAIGKSCNLSLVAEGVETAGQADYLKKAGVDSLQGFMFAPPLPVQDFFAWVEARAKSTTTTTAAS